MIAAATVFHIEESQVKREGSGWRVSWEIPESLPYFTGHFPGLPILPAVAVLDASLAFLSGALDREITLKKVPSAKFLSPLTPGMVVRVDFSISGEKQWQVEWWHVGENERLTATLSLQLH